MTPYILFLLAAFGLAYIVGHSAISLPFRTWLGGTPEKVMPFIDLATSPKTQSTTIPAKPGALGPIGDALCMLIECPACFGFWIGFGCGLIKMVSPPPELLAFAWPFTLGCITAGSNFALSRLTRIS